MQWDTDAKDPSKLAISKAFHSDINDAVLYAWRECKHYFYEAPSETPKRDSNEWMALQEQKEAEAMERAQENAENGDLTDVNDWSDLGIGGDYDDDF